MATQSKKKKKQPPDFYKAFVQIIDGVKCLVLPEAQAEEFFRQFLDDNNICDEGTEHKDDLLSRVFGLETYTIQATGFVEANISMIVRAKSQTEANKFAREKFENKQVRLEDVNVLDPGNKYTVRDVRPKPRAR